MTSPLADNPTTKTALGPKSLLSAGDVLDAGVHTGGTFRMPVCPTESLQETDAGLHLGGGGRKVAARVSIVGGDAPDVFRIVIRRPLAYGTCGVMADDPNGETHKPVSSHFPV